jgi:hypothetical protein
VSDTPGLSPERRAAMRGWVLDYVERRNRLRRRLTFAAAGLLTVSALGGTAWVVVASQHVQERVVFCYEEASLDSEIAEGERMSSDELGDPAKSALAMCGELWSVGVLGEGPVQSEGGYAVPELTLCVRADQSLAVFPNTTSAFCADNGLNSSAD